MFQSDETLDFHNNQIREISLGQRCKNSAQSCAYILTSPLGHVYTNACPKGLHCVKLFGDTNYDKIDWDTKVDMVRASTFLPKNPHVQQLKKWLQLYFSDPLKTKDIELSFCGLEEHGKFNSSVWMAIRNTCPPGELMSYVELAERSGNGPGASKVVGYAINKNPFMLVVGDHRVVKATGEIWCEDDSQRNKLRRLLVNYEISFTDHSLDEALARVRDRNQASKGKRSRSKSTSKSSQGASQTRVKKSTKKTNVRKKSRSKKHDDDDDSEDDDESIEEDDD